MQVYEGYITCPTTEQERLWLEQFLGQLEDESPEEFIYNKQKEGYAVGFKMAEEQKYRPYHLLKVYVKANNLGMIMHIWDGDSVVEQFGSVSAAMEQAVEKIQEQRKAGM